jgi:hypothetical protein
VLTTDAINRATLSYRQQLHALRADARNGVPSGSILPQVGILIDVMTCLLDEAPTEKHRVIHGLIDDFEALRRSLAN